MRRRCGLRLVSRSRRVVPDELVTLTSWDSRDFLIFLVMIGWKGKDAVKDGVVCEREIEREVERKIERE